MSARREHAARAVLALCIGILAACRPTGEREHKLVPADVVDAYVAPPVTSASQRDARSDAPPDNDAPRVFTASNPTRRKGAVLEREGMAHMRAGQLDEAEEEFDLALLNLPDDVTDESPRARLFLELARLARKRGDAEGAQSYYRASYLLSRPMLRHALRPPLPITGEAKEAQANMGTCPVAVVPFKTRSFSARAAAVEFEAQASTSVERFCDGCSEMAPLDEKLADGGSSFDSFVSSHRDSARKVSSADGQIEVKPDLPHALAILAAGGGFTLLDLRMHADGCGNGSCGRGQAVLDGGVWRVTIARDEVPFDYPVCDCVEDSDSWWRSCTGCHGECQCPPYPVTTPSPFGPREAFYIDARSGEPLWHTLEDQNDKYVAPQIDGTGLHVTAVGCPASWPAPKRLADASTKR